MEVASKNSANLEQETKTTKIVTHPLFPPLASSFVEKSHRRDVHVKRSHSRCFHGHNLDTIICVRFHLYLFFPPTVRAITRNGYVVTSWEMAIWPPKLGTLYKVPSELFLGFKSSLFPQGFAHNTIELWSFSWVRKKWRLGGWRSVFEFRGENLTVLCYFCPGFYTTRSQIDGKIRYVAICFLFEKICRYCL